MQKKHHGGTSPFTACTTDKLKKSYHWLEKPGLKDNTEALIMAAQEEALSTRSIEAEVYHTKDTKMLLRQYST